MTVICPRKPYILSIVMQAFIDRVFIYPSIKKYPLWTAGAHNGFTIGISNIFHLVNANTIGQRIDKCTWWKNMYHLFSWWTIALPYFFYIYQSYNSSSLLKLLIYNRFWTQKCSTKVCSLISKCPTSNVKNRRYNTRIMCMNTVHCRGLFVCLKVHFNCRKLKFCSYLVQCLWLTPFLFS